MSNALPLPRGFFGPDVGVPEDARRGYIAQAEAALREVFALADAQRNAWIPVREKKGVAVFRNFSRAGGGGAHRSNVSEVSCRAALQASLPEVARAYAAHDDALFRRLAKKLDPYVLDAAVLHTVVPRTAQAPFRYIGVKWFAVRTPAPLVAARDYCVLEVQDRVVDAFGNEMYVRVLRSIATPECPSLEASHALVRGQLLAGALYRADRAEPHVVRAHHVARVDPCGSFPAQWAYKTTEAQAVSAVVQLRRVLEKQQMSACTFVDRREWVPNRERSRCAVCSRGFGAFRPRHHCRCCGEVICGKCSVFRSVDVPGAALRNVRLCAVCHVSVQRGGLDHDGGISDEFDDLDDTRSVASAASSQTLAHNEMYMVDLSMLAGTSGPSTPSAYSSASSTASDLSFRSTASSRSVADRRTRGLSAQHAALSRTGSQRGAGLYASSTTPRSFYDAATPRSYIANNLTQSAGFGFGGSTGSITPRSDCSSSSNALTPSAAVQRMTSFKQHPLDLGYLRDSVASSSSSSAPAVVARTPSSADCDALELSAASTASAQSSNSSAPFADDKEPPVRGRAMTCQPRVLLECAERESGLAPRRSVARPRKSDDSGARRPFFGSLFSRSAAAAGTTRGVERSCAL